MQREALVMRRSLASAWALVLLAPSALLTAAVLKGGSFRDGVVLGTFPTSILIVIAVVMSVYAREGLEKRALIAWNAWLIIVLAAYGHTFWQGQDSWELLPWANLVLGVAAFPISMVGIPVIYLLFGVFQGGQANQSATAGPLSEFLTVWIVMVLGGNFQWLVLVPKLLARWKRKTLGASR
jgi:hypothetical protein